MLNCNVCGKKAYVDGNAECPSCARLRGYDDIELKRKIRELEDNNDYDQWAGSWAMKRAEAGEHGDER